MTTITKTEQERLETVRGILRGVFDELDLLAKLEATTRRCTSAPKETYGTPCGRSESRKESRTMNKLSQDLPFPADENFNADTGEVIEPQVPAVVESAPVNLFNAPNPLVVVERAVKVADALKSIIKTKQLYTLIQNKAYVRVEGWTLCGSMLGVFPVCTWSRPLENGWEARVEARTMNGTVVGAAEAQCTRSERTWKDRDDYAIRSMAQTRAVSKALRLPLGFIIQMAGYEATPSEEMPS